MTDEELFLQILKEQKPYRMVMESFDYIEVNGVTRFIMDLNLKNKRIVVYSILTNRFTLTFIEEMLLKHFRLEGFKINNHKIKNH